ncbi:hypothetical protein OL239_00315 [Arthrobacter sp. ATA002]|uniref:hypothetical protein n=1 Tax=Arthrobacter sp. ATA002 TaxID=2991715 RepID=UPI0022A7ED07|nr:hypothetical protein [Arthrobacter sp. ATA002]WAP51862.1 hypothetical protein OL239_00315 [Arthrobacter sp. ATA002]
MSPAVQDAAPAADRNSGLAGHNRISTQALTSTAKAAAAEFFDVSPASIRVGWSDDQGMLAMALSLPVSLPALTRIAADPGLVTRSGGSVWDRAHAAKPYLLEKVTALTGSLVSRVDIRVTGVQLSQGSRVR